MGERTSQGVADDDLDHLPDRTQSIERIKGRADTYQLPKEGQMQPKLPTDDHTLQQTKQSLRRLRTTMLPLHPREYRSLEDMRWARQDPDVQTLYIGEFVVPFERKIVAHGVNAEAVLAEAMKITGRPAEELPLVGIVDPLMDIPR